MQGVTNRLRTTVGDYRRDALWIWGLRGLAPRVLWFNWRALRSARRNRDLFSLTSVTRPGDTRVLLELAKGRKRVVELGTATGWTAITLALDDPTRQVVTYDPWDRPELHRYLEMVGRGVRERIEIVTAEGATGPRDEGRVDLLYIDSSHEREPTVAEVRAWQPYLSPGAPVLFDDYTHPEFPGVRQAVEELDLQGETRGKLFIHRHWSSSGQVSPRERFSEQVSRRKRK